MGKLDETRDFIDLYLHHCGLSEVPPAFQLGACLSLLSACVADRVWIERHKASKTLLNLYVFLIGPSGSGKEKAINDAVKFVGENPVVNVYGGRASGPHIIDFLGRQAKAKDGSFQPVNPRMYFITEELGMSVRVGEMAHDLITLMTKLYGKDPYPLREGTRLHGPVLLKDHCVNWLAGSTEQWLIRSVTRDAIEGGFFARVLAIFGQRNYDERYPEIIYPDDYDEVKEHLQRRIDAYIDLEGDYQLDDEARQYHYDWYMQRIVPTDASLYPMFNRSDEMIAKLACLFALSEWDVTQERVPQGWICARHLERAITMFDSFSSTTPQVLKLSSSTPESNDVTIISDIIHGFGEIEYSALLKKAWHKGMNADRVKKALRHLEEQEDVQRCAPHNGRRTSVWKWLG